MKLKNSPSNNSNNISQSFVVPSLLLGAIALTSCSAANNKSAVISRAPVESMPAPAAISSAADRAIAAAEVPKAAPQLIKRAELNLVVPSIKETIETVSGLIQQQQGDVLGLQEYQPANKNVRHRASMQLRVPQARLETTLDALSELGTMQNRTITAEDVSNQLVDLEARLRNLRKSEDMVLKIMERSGTVGEVLNAARELSNIRESIERIDAQFKNLQNQVAYSTINLNLEAAVSSSATPQLSIGLRVRETWGQATQAVNEFTFGLIQLGLWLLAFSPYLLLVFAGGALGYMRLQKQKSLPPKQPENPPM
ncbi:MAG: DUF4349 domain-containing protein [Hormoscilla sp.]